MTSTGFSFEREVEDLRDLLDVSLRFSATCSRRELDARRRLVGRIADPAGEVADQQDHLVAEVLELAQLLDRDRVADVDDRARRVDADVDADLLDRSAAPSRTPRGREDLDDAASEQPLDRIESRRPNVRELGSVGVSTPTKPVATVAPSRARAGPASSLGRCPSLRLGVPAKPSIGKKIVRLACVTFARSPSRQTQRRVRTSSSSA